MNSLAVVYRRRGKLTEAEELQRRLLDFNLRKEGEESSRTLGSMNNLANILAEQGELAEAEGLFRKVLDINRRVMGEEHPDTFRMMINLAGQAHGAVVALAGTWNVRP